MCFILVMNFILYYFMSKVQLLFFGDFSSITATTTTTLAFQGENQVLKSTKKNGMEFI